jgi:enoyl-CoA hydratase/carnithine racemase
MPVVERERRGRVEILTINRPEASNAINYEVSHALSSAFDRLTIDDQCLVVVLTGAGDKSFSAGMDLKAFAAGEGPAVLGVPGGFGGIVERDFPKPIIAAVNGACLAGGCEIMLACDLAISVDHARFGIPEVKLGLIAGSGGAFRLPKRIPRAIAMELGLTGRTLDAQRAVQLGLINQVVPAAALIDVVLDLANEIADNAPLAVRWTKRMMRQAADFPENEAWKINAEAVATVLASSDAVEGPTAFVGKRKPSWDNR